jgi:PAS domain S-box-containing protein
VSQQAGELGPAEKLAVLTRAAALLSSTRDFAHTLEQTIAACLPVLGDFGFFDLVVEGKEVARTSRAHQDDRIEQILRPTRWVRQERTDMNLCALSTGEPALHPEIDDAWYRAIAVNEGHLEVLRALAFRSMISVPLRLADEVVGALTLFYGSSNRRYDHVQLAFAQELAALVVPIVANARLVERHRRAQEALRISEERLRLALEAGRLGIWDWNIATDEVVWSDRVYELHGIRPGEFAGTVRDFTELVHADDRPRVATAIAAAIERDEPYTIEFRVPVGEGTRWLTTRAAVLRDGDGQATRMVGATYDITERVELLQVAEQARKQAEAANRVKDEFLAILGHELRNPLAPIVTALHLMDRRGEPATAREREIIARQVAHLSRLIDDLLDISRIVSGKVEIARAAVDLRGVVERSLEMARPLFEQSSVTIECVLDGEPLWVEGDAVRLAQVVANLLVNAAKFSRAGGRVEVRLEARQGELELVVRDWGVGIEPGLLPRVFELFVQGAQPLDRRSGGLGLGLAIVARLIELHGGRVTAHSDGPGQGATFSVVLPRSTQQQHEVSPPAEPVLARGRLLIVDDNVDVTVLLAELLRDCGFEVTAASSGAEALRVIEGARPDIAILDIGLPGMSGYELARELRARPELQALRLIAMTGYGRATDRDAAHAAGFDRHVVKPVAPDELLALLHELLPRDHRFE